MKRQHMMWCAAALIAGGVTALTVDAPASAVLVVLLGLVVLACPVMMMFMMNRGRGRSSDRNPYPVELNRIPLMMRGGDRMGTLIGQVASVKRDDVVLAGKRCTSIAGDAARFILPHRINALTAGGSTHQRK